MTRLVRITLNIDGRDVHNLKGGLTEDKSLSRGEMPVEWQASNVLVGAKNINDAVYRLMGIIENYDPTQYKICIEGY